MLNNHRNPRWSFAIAVLLMSIAMTPAHAEDDDNEGGRIATASNAKWKEDCGSCHLAYPPGLLPAESWRKVMNGLDKHFGSDASLTEQENKEITTFLVNNASNRWSAPTAPLRITETSWFKRKHDGHEISPSVWKNPLVKSPSNCAACHTKADSGSFNEHDIRMPR